MADKTMMDQIEISEQEAQRNGVSKAADRAPEYVRSLTPEQRIIVENKLRQKIDLRLLPMVIVIYVMNYLDRNNIAAARLAGLEKDLNMQGNDFNTAVSILFAGYLLMQVPSNMLLNKFGKPAIYLPSCMIVWGIISGLTAVCSNYAGLLACRFFLGFVEAAYFPGALYYLSTWYTKKELVKRTALLYCGSLISGAFSGLITAGITNGMDGARGYSAWRWLFIIEGCMTVVIAFGAYWILPNLPRTTPWLTEEEKQLAAWRLDEDVGEDDWVDSKHQSPFHGAKLAFKDPKTWLLLFTIYGSTSAGTVTTFFPIVMKGLGRNNVDTLLLTTPPYLIGVICLIINAWHADKTGERYLHIALPQVVALVAFIVAATTVDFAPRYVAMCLMIPGIYSGYVVALGYISNVLPRPAAKRASALALINALSNVCQIYSPYLYPSTAGPRYVNAFCVNCGMSVMTVIFATILRLLLGRLNKKLDRGEAVHGVALQRTDTNIRAAEEQGLPGEAIERGFRFLL